MLNRTSSRSISVATMFVVAAAASVAIAQPAGHDWFDNAVRPVLVKRCIECHNVNDREGGLQLDNRAALLRGGDRGPAIDSVTPGKSLLLQAVGYQRPDLRMPPDGRLPSAEIAILQAWIAQGLPWPNGGGTIEPPKRGFSISRKQREHWAFQPLRKPCSPAGGRLARMGNDLDALVDAALAAKGLGFAPSADAYSLARRVAFDLIGLPPEPSDVVEFAAQPNEETYRGYVDRLLASPHFGERWGRHWLDNAGYADVYGGDNDAGTIKLAENKWKYRDYVVRAFNEDLPFDRFVTEQLAGDETVAWRTATRYAPDIETKLIATGFLRNMADDTNEKELNTLDIRYGVLQRTIESVANNLLGLTMQCAKCHDHKYEPISQRDYYSLQAIFQPALNPDRWLPPEQRQLPSVSAMERERLEPKGKTSKDKSKQPAWQHWQVVYDVGAATPTRLLKRGNPLAPGEEVPADIPAVLRADAQSPFDRRAQDGGSTGRRSALARLCTDPNNAAGALAVRVRVNRIWAHLFGAGLVDTTDNFGLTGAPPTHPQLLEWLAFEFVAGGQRLKPFLRRILHSTTYRQASAHDNPTAERIDPDNRMLWRQRLRRLESEAVRDALLAVSGELDRALGGPPIPVQPQPDGSFVVDAKKLPSPVAAHRRSIYLLARRNYHPALLAAFDQPCMTTHCASRQRSAVVGQALAMLNDEFVMDRAAAFARSLPANVSTDAWVNLAFLRAFGRPAGASERSWSRRFLAAGDAPMPAVGHVAGRDPPIDRRVLLLQSLFNASEFVVVP